MTEKINRTCSNCAAYRSRGPEIGHCTSKYTPKGFLRKPLHTHCPLFQPKEKT